MKTVQALDIFSIMKLFSCTRMPTCLRARARRGAHRHIRIPAMVAESIGPRVVENQYLHAASSDTQVSEGNCLSQSFCKLIARE